MLLLLLRAARRPAPQPRQRQPAQVHPSQVGAAHVKPVARPLRLLAPDDRATIVIMYGEEPLHVSARKRLPCKGVNSLPDVGRDATALGQELRAIGGDLRLLPPGLS